MIICKFLKMTLFKLFLLIIYCGYALSAVNKMKKNPELYDVNVDYGESDSQLVNNTEYTRRSLDTEKTDAEELAEFYDEEVTEQPLQKKDRDNEDYKKVIHVHNSDCNGDCQRIKTVYSPFPPNNYGRQVLRPGVFKFHMELKSWNDARKTCIAEQGHLAVITSPDEQKQISDWTKQNTINEAWLGVHELFHFNEWVTVTDEPLEQVGYINWLPDEPNRYEGREHCMSFMHHKGFNDRDCLFTYPFVCRVPFYN